MISTPYSKACFTGSKIIRILGSFQGRGANTGTENYILVLPFYFTSGKRKG